MEKIRNIEYLSEKDGSMQPALVRGAEGDEARPLIVCLHTWSADIDKQVYYERYVNKCKEYNWHFIFPRFRGPNWLPEACGSDLVVSDLVCAVTYMKQNFNVDETKVFLVGGSGGGHASLLMAGRCPEIFTAISSWCPISDVKAWHGQVKAAKKNPLGRSYDNHIEEACGGNPSENIEAAKQAEYRSPLTWLENAKDKVILDIGAGIHDGHTGSVPISQSLYAFNKVALEKDRISDEDIEYMVKNQAVPAHLLFDGVDEAYGANKVWFRRVSGNVRITVFEGGHDMVIPAAFGFLNNQERGKQPVWNSGKVSADSAMGLTK
jgi:pimeloyl-ACP methyl ester carboxylesterase